MSEVILVKKINSNSFVSVVKSVLKMMKDMPWTMLVSAILLISLYGLIFENELFKTIPKEFGLILICISSYITVIFGNILGRNYILNKDTISVKILYQDLMLSLVLYFYFNRLKIIIGIMVAMLVIQIPIDTLNISQNILDFINIKEMNLLMLASTLFIAVSGMLSIIEQGVYMYYDALVKIIEKGKERTSKSKTDKNVKKYIEIMKEKNSLFKLSLEFFLVILLISLNDNYFYPLVLLFGGYFINAIYLQSFKKQMSSSSDLKDYLKVIKEDDVVENESNIEEDRELDSSNILKDNKEFLTKESVLGENWYLNDRKSVIEDEDENEEDGDEPPVEEVK